MNEQTIVFPEGVQVAGSTRCDLTMGLIPQERIEDLLRDLEAISETVVHVEDRLLRLIEVVHAQVEVNRFEKFYKSLAKYGCYSDQEIRKAYARQQENGSIPHPQV